MLWRTEQASTEAWLADIDAARRDIAAARAQLAAVQVVATALIPATAWASPAMTAFQSDLARWVDRLVRLDESLAAHDRSLGDARLRLLAHGWNGLG
jgi:hypothetical protein